ncbi:unnamed protein product [Trichobilharzia regenti]|nr:unnamed protein product [Trichobilharzia regenti]
MQEQTSKNRLIIEEDSKRGLICSVTSSSAQTKSKTNILTKDDKFYLSHNSFVVDVPIAILFKAMNITSDQELLQLIGTEESVWANFVPSLKLCLEYNVSWFAFCFPYSLNIFIIWYHLKVKLIM